MDLISDKIICMYCLKMNGLDKEKVYISCIVGHGLHLKLTNSSTGCKDKYLYIIGDF